MTLEERVRALAPLGFSPRQTRFLVTVALHSGFCLRRQYAAFAGIKQGAPVRGFLEKLVHRNLARRVTYRRDRGYLYHLHAASVYRALGQDDNRNRRLTGPALIARKLMLLDFVISEPGVEWLATETEKVTAFTVRGVNYFCRLATTISAGEGAAKECRPPPGDTRLLSSAGWWP